jgi:hypothetical protein
MALIVSIIIAAAINSTSLIEKNENEKMSQNDFTMTAQRDDSVMPVPVGVEETEKERDDDDTEDYPFEANSALAYIKWRWTNSVMWSYWGRKSIQRETVDDAVSTLTIVNALTLTIPFQTMSDLGQDFWETLKTKMLNCDGFNGQTSDITDQYELT